MTYRKSESEWEESRTFPVYDYFVAYDPCSQNICCQSRKQKRNENQPILKPKSNTRWFILPLLLATPTIGRSEIQQGTGASFKF